MPRRILIIGSGGSGKTTLARRLAAITGLPLVHLDAVYWRPGWNPTPSEEWQEKVRRLVEQDQWILDGNYGGTLDLRLEACDAVIFLDVSRWTCLRRVIVRRIQNRRHELPDSERLTWEFLWWIWTYPKRRRAGIITRLSRLPAEKQVWILRNDAQVDRCVREFST